MKFKNIKQQITTGILSLAMASSMGITAFAAGDNDTENEGDVPAEEAVQGRTDNSAPDVYSFKVTRATSEAIADATISGVDDSMEYRTRAGGAWTEVEAGQDTIEGLASGTVWIRYKATDTMPASNATIVSIYVKSGTETGETIIPSDADRAKLNIYGVEDDAVVKAYQIIKPTYTSNGFSSFELVTQNLKVKDFTRPQASEIATIARQIQAAEAKDEVILKSGEGTPGYNLKMLGLSDPINLTQEKAGDPYTADAPAGMFIVIVSKTGNSDAVKIYNPMIISNYYTKAGDASTLGISYAKSPEPTTNYQVTSVEEGDEGAKTNANDFFWNVNTVANHDGTLNFNSSKIYAKSSTPSVRKRILRTTASPKIGDKTVDLCVGDRVEFQVEFTIPSYSDAYQNPVFEIHDKLPQGFTWDMDHIMGITFENFNINDYHRNYHPEDHLSYHDVVTDQRKPYEHKVTGEQFVVKSVEISDMQIGEDWIVNHTTVSGDNTQETEDLVIHFSREALRKYALTTMTFTYWGIVNEDLVHAIDDNALNQDYFNDNANIAYIKYTSMLGEAPIETEKDVTHQYTYNLTNEILKVNDNTESVIWEYDPETGEENVTCASKSIASDVEPGAFLPGAKFRLTSLLTGETFDTVSDEKGQIRFNHLRSGKYQLVETAAPDGYAINSRIYSVIIDPTYDENTGELTKYVVTTQDISGGNGEGQTGQATYTKVSTTDESTGETISYINQAVSPAMFKNSRLQNLPSTGGIGIKTFLTVGGGIGLCAAFFFGVVKHKEDQARKQLNK